MVNSTWSAVDDTFGPFVEPISTSDFDFTSLFEESIFAIGPSSLLLLLAPIRILQLSHGPQRVAAGHLGPLKLVN
jgi:ATP-binding cassette, subfamily C (CFTR/MRP), member 1